MTDLFQYGETVLEYHFYNRDKINQRPTVLFLHGTPGCVEQTSVYCDELIQAGIPIIGVSRPGYGKTPLAGDTASFAQQAALCVALLDMLDIDHVIGYGVSGGVPIIMEICRHHKQRIQAVILESGVISFYHHRDRTLYQRITDYLVYTRLGHHIFTRVMQLFPMLFNGLSLVRYSSLPFRSLWAEARYMTHDRVVVERLRKLMTSISKLPENRIGYENDLNELIFNRVDYIDDLPEHILILHGTADCEVPVREADLVMVAKRKSWLAEIIDASHILPISSRHRFVSTRKLEFIQTL